MYVEKDFSLQNGEFTVRKDTYAIRKISAIKVEKTSWVGNVLQMAFWVFIFSFAVWLAWSQFDNPGTLYLAIVLSVMGLMLGVKYTNKYALKIEFQHGDGTGRQWLTVARCRTGKSLAVFDHQVTKLSKVI